MPNNAPFVFSQNKKFWPAPSESRSNQVVKDYHSHSHKQNKMHFKKLLLSFAWVY